MLEQTSGPLLDGLKESKTTLRFTQTENVRLQAVAGGVVGLTEVLEGAQLYLSHCTGGLGFYPPIILMKNVLHQDKHRGHIKRMVCTATPIHLPQAQFPTEGPESLAEVWDPTTGFLADIPQIKLGVEIITPASGKIRRGEPSEGATAVKVLAVWYRSAPPASLGSGTPLASGWRCVQTAHSLSVPVSAEGSGLSSTRHSPSPRSRIRKHLFPAWLNGALCWR